MRKDALSLCGKTLFPYVERRHFLMRKDALSLCGKAPFPYAERRSFLMRKGALSLCRGCVKTKEMGVWELGNERGDKY
jgi:hypothetical protein